MSDYLLRQKLEACERAFAQEEDRNLIASSKIRKLSEALVKSESQVVRLRRALEDIVDCENSPNDVAMATAALVDVGMWWPADKPKSK